ncbi:MAG: InlB B-repeat-containing protein [Holophagaceae bacterium]
MVFKVAKFLAPLILLAALPFGCGGGGGSSPAPIPTYTISFVAGNGGTLTGTASQTITSGGSTTAVTAVPNTGYVFTNWTGTGFTTSTSNPLTLTNVTAAATITANFTATYAVTFVAGTGGTITGTASQTILSGGNSSAITAVPNAGYTFTNWTGTGFATSTSNPLILTNVTSAATITANFTAIPIYSVTFVAGAGGTVTGSASQSILSGGSTTVVSAVANAGYAFSNWTGTGFTASTTNPLTVTNVLANLTITANFSQLPATTLGYTDPTTGTYLLKRNAALSTTTHLVLDVVGPTTGTANGLTVAFSADTAKVTWVDVPAGGTTSNLISNGTQFNLGSGIQIIKAKATGTSLQATIAQKGAPLASLNGTLFRVALDLKTGTTYPGTITLSSDNSKALVLDSSGNLSPITVTVGTLTAQ